MSAVCTARTTGMNRCNSAGGGDQLLSGRTASAPAPAPVRVGATRTTGSTTTTTRATPTRNRIYSLHRHYRYDGADKHVIHNSSEFFARSVLFEFLVSIFHLFATNRRT